MHVRLIGKANGVGLSRDFELLDSALRAAGCAVTRYGCERRDRKRRRSVIARLGAHLRRLRRPAAARYDVNIMLEHAWPQFLHEARCNVLVPNPEWFDRRDLAFLRAIDWVWAKSALAERLFSERGRRCRRIGFDSEDRLLAQVERAPRFLHLAGRSPLKGTERLLSLWRRHPEWPQLTLVQDAPRADKSGGASAANIVELRDYLTDVQLRELQNSHRFHLCTSEAEGWGHYIAEALSVQALTLTCDAPPMNELVEPGRGMLLSAHAGAVQNLVRLALFDDSALEAAVRRCLTLREGELEAIGAAGRAWFLENKRGFASRVARALAELEHTLSGATSALAQVQP